MKRVLLLLSMLLFLACGSDPNYPKYHLAEQVVADGCTGVVVEAIYGGGTWEYSVAFQLQCPTCTKQPGWMTAVQIRTFEEKELSPVPAPPMKQPEPMEVPGP